MASQETTHFPSVHPDRFSGQDQDGLPVARYPSTQLGFDEEDDPRTDTGYDGTTSADDGSSSGEAPPSPDAQGARAVRTGRAAYREALVERAWEMRRSESPVATGCRLLVRPRGRLSRRRMRMDVEEVKACRDLGLELPDDWTYEISAADRPRSAGSSPARGWRISHPDGDPSDVKAKLKVWAQAVAAVSASRLSS